MSTYQEPHTLVIRHDSIGVVIRIDGRLVYWYSQEARVAWDREREYPLSQAQVDKLLVEAPECNADKFGR